MSAAGGVQFSRAQALYAQGEYDSALAILLPWPEKDGPLDLLIGQCYYSMGDAKSSSAYLERAVAADPRDPQCHHWLGRAYGRRAESASVFTAGVWAVRARQSFERAFELDPGNLETINDLFEYYLEAPGFLGGSVDKAAVLADRARSLDRGEHQYHLARLAEKRGQLQTAEKSYRRAADADPNDVGRLIDLAEFLERQGRLQESDSVLERAHKMSPEAPNLLFEQAKTHVESRRNLEGGPAY